MFVLHRIYSTLEKDSVKKPTKGRAFQIYVEGNDYLLLQQDRQFGERIFYLAANFKTTQVFATLRNTFVNQIN